MDVLALHADRAPDAPAVVDGGRTLTWSALVDRRNRLADALAALGLAPGERAAVWALNTPDVIVASAACQAAGAVPVAVNHRLTADEVEYILADAGAAVVFFGAEFLPIAEAVRPRASARHWVCLGPAEPPWALAVEDLVASGRPVPPAAPLGVGAGMLYTGGTTGRPKGAVRGPVDPAYTRKVMAEFGITGPEEVHLVAGPLYHAAPRGFALYTQLAGGTLVLMRRYDPAEAVALMARHRVTSTFMAPTMLKRLLAAVASAPAPPHLPALRAIVIGGAPCPNAVKEDCGRLLGPVLYEFYGSSELGMNTILRPEDTLRRPGSCGRAAPFVELAVLDDEGRPVPPGTPGELHVRRHPGVFTGYHNKPEATREVFRGEWASVGDVARIDEDGYVYICDRRRDMIISGGVNIYPAEIEDVLHRHPDVADVAVFGVPDDEWGERVHAAVQLRPGASLTAEALSGFARRHLAGYKIPREVTFHAALPRDSAGKLLKRVLREPYWAGRATRV